MDEYKVDRSQIRVETTGTLTSDKEYWLKLTPGERLNALEFLRKISFGYDSDTPRLQRVLEITSRPPR